MVRSKLGVDTFSKLKNETGKHKDWYGPKYVSALCAVINPNDAYFSSKRFGKSYTERYCNLELNDRLSLIAELLHSSLGGTYKEQLAILSELFGPPLEAEVGMFKIGFYLYPLSKFVENYGEEDLSRSLDFIFELTKRFTGEWAIRTIANADEKLTLKTMKSWVKDENFHVRRLASEGLRLRLPWGKKIDWIDKAPNKSIPIYTKLRNDKILYVRRSVANSMGDLLKRDADMAHECFENWLSKKKTRENLWVIKHAIRTPLKKQDKRCIALRKQLEKFEKEL